MQTNGTSSSQQIHQSDAMTDAIATMAAPVCVGLDPVLERLPKSLQDRSPVAAMAHFCQGVLDAVAGVVPVVKFQAACFERYGAAGVDILEQMVTAAQERHLIVILDAKRGDIGISAEHYAHAAFSVMHSDWITANAYLGLDGIEPFLATGGGCFTLVRTSNKSATEFQEAAMANGQTVAEVMATCVAQWGAKYVGQSGFSALGAVVGATCPESAAKLRSLMPQQIFLVPGYGAQGGSAETVRNCFAREGKGAVVTASRSVIYADIQQGQSWQEAVGQEARRFADEIGSMVGLR